MPLKQTTESNDVLCDFDPTVSADECKLCCHFDQQCKSGRPYKRKQFAEYIASCLGIFDHQWCTFLRDHTNWKWLILNGFWIKCSHKCCLFQTPVSVILIFCFYQLIVDASKPVYARSQVCKKFRCWLTTMWKSSKWCLLHRKVFLNWLPDCLFSMALASLSIV